MAMERPPRVRVVVGIIDPMAPTKLNPRSIQNEAPHLPASVDDLAAVGDQLLELGYSVPVVQGILGWLSLKASGRRDLTAATTRSRYRRILAELDSATVDRVIPG